MKSNITKILYKLLLILLGAGISTAVFVILFSGLWKYRALDQTLKETIKASYNITEYNCVNFSEDAVTQLRSHNINSNVVVIKQNPTDSKTHAVVGVWIDPQNGKLVSNAEYVGDYTELSNKFGWNR